MSKRQAEFQITRDAGNGGSDDDDAGGPARASASVLAQRKIAKPRSRAAATISSATAAASNPFAGLKAAPPAFGGSLGASAPSAAPVGGTPTGGAPFAGLKFGSNSNSLSNATPAFNSAPKVPGDRTELRIRALNEKFATTVANAKIESVYGDWRSLCNNYLRYYNQILAGKSTTATPEPSVIESSLDVQDKSMAGGTPEPEPKSGLTSTGFKFASSAAKTAATTFSFGNKTVDISTAPKPQGTGPSGFVFQPNGSGQVVGKFELAKHDSDSDSDSSESDEDSQPAKTIAAPKAVEGKPADTEAKPTFSFNSAKPTEPAASVPFNTKPAFSFGPKPTQPDAAASADKPTFSFGSSSDKPKFTFGASSTATDQPKPLFGANTAASGEKPKLSFGNSDDKPKLSFGSSEDKPKLSFGSGSTEDKSFSFGKSVFGAKDSSSNGDSSSKPAFSFGAAATSTPSPAPDVESKPAFSFSGAGATSTSTKSDSKPAFSFGTGANPFAAKGSNLTSSLAWTPGQPVKIDDSAADRLTEKPSAAKEGEEFQREPGDDAPEDPQVKLDGPGPGEENEDCPYEKRAKAFELVDGDYKLVGLGNLRVLVDKDTKRSRALLRAEGSGRVLINAALRKAFTYSAIGKGQVKLLDVRAGETAPVVYVLRVKTEADGNELAKTLEDVKQ